MAKAMTPDDLKEMTAKQLEDEFYRLAHLRDDCEASMRVIRNEQARRKDVEIARLRVELAQKAFK